MNSRKIRENTFRVEFAKLPKKPTSEEVHNFVGLQLGITRSQLVRIQLSNTDECAFVKVTDQAIAQQVVDQFDNKFDYDIKGVKYKLRLRMADGCVDVRLHDLSENITNEQVKRYMEAYGEVVSVQELLWSEKHHFPGLSSGIRLVRMVLREPIKSYVTIDGETTLATYPKQRQTCRHCGEYLHTGISCVQNKKLLAQKAGLNDRLNKASYAGAVRGRQTTSDSHNPEIGETSGLAQPTNASSSNGSIVVATNKPGSSTSSMQETVRTEETNGLRKDSEMETNSINTVASEDVRETSDNIQNEQTEGDDKDLHGEEDKVIDVDADHDGSVEMSDSSCQSAVAQTAKALLGVASRESDVQKGKHKQDDTNTSDDSNPFTVIERRGRGRPKKLKQ